MEGFEPTLTCLMVGLKRDSQHISGNERTMNLTSIKNSLVLASVGFSMVVLSGCGGGEKEGAAVSKPSVPNSVREKINEGKAEVKEKAGEVKDAVKEKAAEVKEKAGEVKAEIKEKAAEVKDAVKEKAAEVKAEVKDAVKKVGEEVKKADAPK